MGSRLSIGMIAILALVGCDTSQSSQARADIQSVLRNAATVQETIFVQRDRYTDEPDEIVTMMRDTITQQPYPPPTVSITHAEGDETTYCVEAEAEGAGTWHVAKENPTPSEGACP